MIIYKVTNLINGKMYVGQTTRDLSYRMSQHLRSSRHSRPSILGKAIKKYGFQYFKFENIDTANTKDELNSKEIFWIKNLSTQIPYGYNILPGGEGIAMTEYVKNRISESCKGKKRKPFSEEHKRRISESGKGKKKGKRSQEWCSAHSEKLKGRKHSKETIQKIIKGRSLSISCNETKEVFESLKMAAQTHGISRGNLSKHLKGKHRYLTSKKTFERLTFKYLRYYGDPK